MAWCDACGQAVALQRLILVRGVATGHIAHRFCVACRDRWLMAEGQREAAALRRADIRAGRARRTREAGPALCGECGVVVQGPQTRGRCRACYRAALRAGAFAAGQEAVG